MARQAGEGTAVRKSSLLPCSCCQRKGKVSRVLHESHNRREHKEGCQAPILWSLGYKDLHLSQYSFVTHWARDISEGT